MPWYTVLTLRQQLAHLHITDITYFPVTLNKLSPLVSENNYLF